jgi:two-component system phosphate regulon sensor histidine kinase PhoR
MVKDLGHRMLEETSVAQPKPYDWSHFIIQKAPAGVITMDGQGRITTCNPAAEEITGYKEEQILGRLAQDVMHCKRGEDEDCPIMLAIQGQDIENQETVLLNSSGQEVPVMLRAFALKDNLGVQLGGVTIFQDLTAVKHLEKERRHLVNMFAHDLKTPVVGMAGLIRRMLQGKSGPLSEVQMSYLETVDDGMKKLEDLINKFLEFARLDLRFLKPLPSAIQVEEECQEIIGSLLPVAETKGVELATEYPAEILVLQADPLLFRRVLENLLGNAIKYAPPQTSVLLQVQRNGREVRFAVKDQGPGISPQDVPHIFEIFYRGKSAGKEQGFGLGLATVKRIIDAHGGRIWLDTSPGGTTFFFTFPLEV